MAARPSDSDPVDPAERVLGRPRLTYLAKRLESAVRQNLDLHVQTQGLTTPQYATLSTMQRQPGLSSAQLARRAFVTPQSMQVMIAAFVRDGLVERRADAENQRILRNYLTEVGEALLSRSEEAGARVEEQMLAGLTEEQVSQLRDLMTVCIRNLSSARPNPPPSAQSAGTPS